MIFAPPESARSILEKRYYQPGEDWEGMCRRVAKFAAQAEEEPVRKEWEDKFFRLMVNGLALPNSPALANGGTGKKGSIAACFTFTVEDTIESILEVRRLAAMTLKYGGGVGFEVSSLRPKNFPIQSTHRNACGPVAVVKDYNALGDLITQGGMRKAALLALLRIDHPDIIEFIHCKERDKALANFNISVAVPDSFMRKLLKEKDKPHVCYFGGKQYYLLQDGTPIPRTERESKKVISVGDLWGMVCSHAALNGDPGLLFIDTINKANPFINGPEDISHPLYFKGANPCGEVLIPHAGACCLASVDLAKYVIDGVINTEALYIAFRETTRMLDNLLEISPWPDPLIEKTMKETRMIGVGVMGFTSMLDKLGLRYGSEESLRLIDNIGALRQKACSDESIQLGKERGIYPAAKEGEIHRNSVREVNPPTGSLAMFANTSWAIEPHLFWAFEERRNDEVRTRYLPIVEELLTREQLEPLEAEAAGDLKRLNELIQQVLPSYMTLSRDISPEEQLAVVARWQKYTGNSTSKTIVSSKEILTPEKVEDIFQAAWELKLKGITVYAEGSREGEPMGISKKKTPKIVLPDELDSKRFKVELDVDGQPMKAFLHVGFHPSDKLKPVEIFLQHPYTKNLTFVQFVSALTRLVSLSLRYRTCPYCGEEALPIGQIIKQLDETDGQSLFSVPKMLTHVLSKFAGDGEVVGKCPECGADLITTGRCVSCSAGCGWSRCG